VSRIEVRLNPDVTPAGSDLSIVNAARRSFNKRSEWEEYLTDKNTIGRRLKSSDKRLLHFLARGMTADDFDGALTTVFETVDYEHGYGDHTDYKKLAELLWQWRNTPTHETPFNHTFISFEVKAPIFVARQLVKHEYLIMSEFSRRYITDDIEFYEPDYWRKASPNKKQGSLEEPVEQPLYKRMHGTKTTQEAVKHMQELQVDLFKDVIEQGVAPEQARMVLPKAP
jgi:thymidylate synthase (FAD)